MISDKKQNLVNSLKDIEININNLYHFIKNEYGDYFEKDLFKRELEKLFNNIRIEYNLSLGIVPKSAFFVKFPFHISALDNIKLNVEIHNRNNNTGFSYKFDLGLHKIPEDIDDDIIDEIYEIVNIEFEDPFVALNEWEEGWGFELTSLDKYNSSIKNNI